MLHSDRRSARSIALSEYSSASEPDFRVEQSPVSANKLLLVWRTHNRQDTVCFRTVDFINHALFSVIIRFNDPASRQTEPPAVSSQRICYVQEIFVCICKQEYFLLIFLKIF